MRFRNWFYACIHSVGRGEDTSSPTENNRNDDGTLRHNVNVHAGPCLGNPSAAARLVLCQALIDASPEPISVYECSTGKLLLSNTAFRDLPGGCSDLPTLFSLDPSSLHDALSRVHAGHSWRGLIQLPASGQGCLSLPGALQPVTRASTTTGAVSPLPQITPEAAGLDSQPPSRNTANGLATAGSGLRQALQLVAYPSLRLHGAAAAAVGAAVAAPPSPSPSPAWDDAMPGPQLLAPESIGEPAAAAWRPGGGKGLAVIMTAAATDVATATAADTIFKATRAAAAAKAAAQAAAAEAAAQAAAGAAAAAAAAATAVATAAAAEVGSYSLAAQSRPLQPHERRGAVGSTAQGIAACTTITASCMERESDGGGDIATAIASAPATARARGERSGDGGHQFADVLASSSMATAASEALAEGWMTAPTLRAGSTSAIGTADMGAAAAAELLQPFQHSQQQQQDHGHQRQHHQNEERRQRVLTGSSHTEAEAEVCMERLQRIYQSEAGTEWNMPTPFMAYGITSTAQTSKATVTAVAASPLQLRHRSGCLQPAAQPAPLPHSQNLLEALTTSTWGARINARSRWPMRRAATCVALADGGVSDFGGGSGGGGGSHAVTASGEGGGGGSAGGAAFAASDRQPQGRRALACSFGGGSDATAAAAAAAGNPCSAVLPTLNRQYHDHKLPPLDGSAAAAAAGMIYRGGAGSSPKQNTAIWASVTSAPYGPSSPSSDHALDQLPHGVSLYRSYNSGMDTNGFHGSGNGDGDGSGLFAAQGFSMHSALAATAAANGADAATAGAASARGYDGRGTSLSQLPAGVAMCLSGGCHGQHASGPLSGFCFPPRGDGGPPPPPPPPNLLPWRSNQRSADTAEEETHPRYAVSGGLDSAAGVLKSTPCSRSITRCSDGSAAGTGGGGGLSGRARSPVGSAGVLPRMLDLATKVSVRALRYRRSASRLGQSLGGSGGGGNGVMITSELGSGVGWTTADLALGTAMCAVSGAGGGGGSGPASPGMCHSRTGSFGPSIRTAAAAHGVRQPSFSRFWKRAATCSAAVGLQTIQSNESSCRNAGVGVGGSIFASHDAVRWPSTASPPPSPPPPLDAVAGPNSPAPLPPPAGGDVDAETLAVRHGFNSQPSSMTSLAHGVAGGKSGDAAGAAAAASSAVAATARSLVSGRGLPPVQEGSGGALEGLTARHLSSPLLYQVPSATSVGAAGAAASVTGFGAGRVVDCMDVWHEVVVSGLRHPRTDEQLILVTQHDVSARVWAEQQLARVMEAEHSLLEAIFPAHVLEHIAILAAATSTEGHGVDDADGAAGCGGGGGGSPSVLAARPTLKGLEAAAFAEAEAAGLVTAPSAGGGGGTYTRRWEAASPPALPITGDTFLHLATSHSALTVLFCDIQGFTTMCNSVKPATVMSFLNDLYTRLDAMLDAFGVYKVETIGDCYVAAGGLMKVDAETGAVTVRSGDVDPQHAHRTVQFAKAILRAASAVLLPTSGEPVRLRVGIHSGPAMSGVVGTRMPRFCLFGDTINTASRMESTGVPGAIHVSKATRDLTPDEPWEPTGAVEAKGKGLMETYLLKPQNSIAPPPQQQHNHHNHQPV